MAIKKQAFYEGAALHLLVRTSRLISIRHETPFFVLNEQVFVYFKYSTRSRSPWGFTFAADEQLILERRSKENRVVIALICGADGVAAVGYDTYRNIAAPKPAALHIACRRRHGKHYAVSGPDGTSAGKIAPSSWLRIVT